MQSNAGLSLIELAMVEKVIEADLLEVSVYHRLVDRDPLMHDVGCSLGICMQDEICRAGSRCNVCARAEQQADYVYSRS